MIDLRAERLNRGLSLRQAASEIGVPEQSLRRLERGDGVRPATAKKIADYFGVTAIEILPDVSRVA